MLTTKQIIVGSVLYTLMYSIDKNAIEGKRVRKKIMKQLKKVLISNAAIANNKDSYNRAVQMTAPIMDLVVDKMATNSNGDRSKIKVSPSGLIKYLNWKDSSILEPFYLNKKDLDDFEEVYKDSNLLFPSIMYINRLLDTIDVANK